MCVFCTFVLQIGILTFTAVRQALRLCNCLSVQSLSPPLLSNRSDRWTGADLPTGVTCWSSVRESVCGFVILARVCIFVSYKHMHSCTHPLLTHRLDLVHQKREASFVSSFLSLTCVPSADLPAKWSILLITLFIWLSPDMIKHSFSPKPSQLLFFPGLDGM